MKKGTIAVVSAATVEEASEKAEALCKELTEQKPSYITTIPFTE